MKQILVTIDSVGTPVIDARGFTDNSCKAATKPFEDALSGGGGVVTLEDKPEMSIPAPTTEGQHLQH